jgi:hypothetical protein
MALGLWRLLMARGGSGNFSSDDAWHFLADHTDRLVAEAQQAIVNPSNLEPDEYYGEVVPCIVNVLAALHEMTRSAPIPRPEAVADWRTKFMEVWEANIDGLGGSPQHKKDRRAVLKKSFDRLERLARRAFN